MVIVFINIMCVFIDYFRNYLKVLRKIILYKMKFKVRSFEYSKF
jgi:hypothetical protein